MSLRLLQKQTGQTPSQPKAKPKPKPKAKRSAMSLGDFHKKTPGGQQDSWRDRGGYDQPTGSDEIYVPRAKRESKGKSKGKSRLGGNNIVQPVPDSDSWAAPALPQNNNNNSSSWSQGAPQAATDALWAAPVPAAPALPSVDDWGSGSPVTMPVVPALPSADDWGTSSPPECTSGSPEDTGGFVEENKNIDWGKLNQNESDQNNLAVVKTEQFVSEESHKAVQGLTAFMTELKLSSYLDKAKNWCDEMGAVNLQEVWEEKDDFMAEIGLKPLEMKRLQKLTEDDIERLMNSVESNVQAAASSVDNIWGQSARPEVVNQANTELEGMAKHCLEQAMGQGSIQKLQQAISEAKMVSSNVCTKFAEERLQLWKNLDGNLDLCMTTFEKSAKQLNDFMNDAMESNFRIDVAKFERRLKELQNNDQKNIAEADLDTALQSPREIDHLEYAISAAYDFGIDTSHHEKVLAMMKKGEEVVVCLETAVDDNDEQGIVLGLDMSKNHKVPEELIEKAKSKLKEFEDEREKERLADIKRKEKKAKEQQQLLEKDRNLAMEKVNLAILAGKPVKLNSAIKEAKRLGADVLEAEKIHQKLADCEQKLILLMSGEGSKSKDLEDCVKSCKECRLEFDEKEVDKKLQKARELERKLEGENKFERALMSREEEKIENCLREFKDVLGKDKVKEAKGVLKDIEKERKVAEARAGLEAAIAEGSDISALKSAIVAAKSKGLDDLIKTAKDIVHTLEKEAEHAQKQKEAASRIEACIAAEDLEDLKLALKMAKHLDVNVARAEEFVAKFELREKQNDGRKQLQTAVENKNIDDLKVAIDLASGIEGVDVTFAEEALRGLRRAKMQDLLKTAMGDNDTCELQIAIKSAEKSKELGLDDDILRAQEHLKAINDCHEANKKLSAVLENDVTNPSLDDSEYQKKLEAAVVLVTKSKVQSIIDVDLLQQGKTKLKEFEAHHVKKGDTKAVLQMAITSRDIGKLREAIATGKEFSLDVSEAVSLLEQLEAESELSGAVGNRDPERIQHVLDSYKILLGEESIASAEKVIAEIQTLKRREKARSDLKTCMADASIANVQSIKDVIVRCKELSLDVSSEEQTVFALQQLSSSIKSRAVHELRHSISSCENLSLDVSAAQAVLLEVEQEIKMKQAQDEAVEELQSAIKNRNVDQLRTAVQLGLEAGVDVEKAENVLDEVIEENRIRQAKEDATKLLHKACKHRNIDELTSAIANGIECDVDVEKAQRILVEVQEEIRQEQTRESARLLLSEAIAKRDVSALKKAILDGKAADVSVMEAEDCLLEVEEEIRVEKERETARQKLSDAIHKRDVELLNSAIDFASAFSVDTTDAETLVNEIKAENLKRQQQEEAREKLEDAVATRNSGDLEEAIEFARQHEVDVTNASAVFKEVVAAERLQAARDGTGLSNLHAQASQIGGRARQMIIFARRNKIAQWRATLICQQTCPGNNGGPPTPSAHPTRPFSIAELSFCLCT